MARRTLRVGFILAIGAVWFLLCGPASASTPPDPGLGTPAATATPAPATAEPSETPATPSNAAELSGAMNGVAPQTPVPLEKSNYLYELAAAEKKAAAESSEPQLPPGQAYVPWEKRRGPAYPGDFWNSFGRDLKELPLTLWDDTKATFTDPVSLVLLVAAGASGIAINASGADDCVEDFYTKRGSQLNTFWDEVGEVGGNPGTHFAIAGAMYFYGLAAADTKTYEVSKTLINGLAINGLLTIGLKVAFNTESPNGDEFGWPSGHASSSFTMATILYHEYGPWVGIPAFAFASYVGWERIDARNHDFSDVISGAMIGIAVGWAVSQNHDFKVFGMDVVPYVDVARNGYGLGLAKNW